MPWLLLMMTMMMGQDHHRAMNDRGAIVMGFDQEKTVHHFHLYQDGGAIDIAVDEVSDAKNRDAIRAHLPHIASMFGAGSFGAPMLVHDTATVPGIAILKERKAQVRYEYVETAAGGRVDIKTSDPAALAALHDFLRFLACACSLMTGMRASTPRRPDSAHGCWTCSKAGRCSSVARRSE